MAHVRFTADYDYRPSDRPRVVVAYKAGMSVTVKRECADDAIAKGLSGRGRTGAARADAARGRYDQGLGSCASGSA